MNKKKWKKLAIIGASLLCMTMLGDFSARAEDTAETETVLDSGAVVKQIPDISMYREKDDFEAPRATDVLSEAYADYIFAGWYTDANCAKEVALESTVTSDSLGETTSAYAKFVPKDILGVKAQITANTTYGTADSVAIRFVTSVDSLDYEKVGFDFVIFEEGRVKEGRETNTVYRKLYGLDSDGKVLNYSPRYVFDSILSVF